MDIIIPEFPAGNGSAFMDGLERELRLGIEREKVNYGLRARMIGEGIRASDTGRRCVDGLGQLTAVIDARTFFRWEMEDPDFWADRGNFKRFVADNPEVDPKHWLK